MGSAIRKESDATIRKAQALFKPYRNDGGPGTLAYDALGEVLALRKLLREASRIVAYWRSNGDITSHVAERYDRTLARCARALASRPQPRRRKQ